MKERTLIRICLLGSVLGIISLYFLSFMIVAVDVGAGEISQEHIGRKVRLSGTVQELSIHRSGHMFFELADDTGSIDVAIWEDRVEQLALSGMDMSRLKNGAEIELAGDVEYYKGGLQVVV